MIAAADEYLQIAMAMAGRVRTLRLALEEGMRAPEEALDELGGQVQEVKDHLLPLVGRIHLLFGPNSVTAARVREIEAALERLRLAYVAWMSDGARAREDADSVASEVDGAIVRFSLAARHEVRFGIFSRWIKQRRGPDPRSLSTAKGDLDQ
jgi:hypothetical protein